MTARNMIYVGRDRVQIGPWKSSATVANLIPFAGREVVTVAAVEKAVDESVDLGFTSTFTAALTPPQAEPFLAAGFTLFEELHLLRRALSKETTVDRGISRKARKSDWDDVLELDALAFEPFWQFDRLALADATRATPRHRFQVIKSEPVLGYHVTGLAGANAYVQRIAVHPDAQGNGYGKALVAHSLRWAWRNGATSAQVNTQIKNERAVALYQRCGFSLAPFRLFVLHRSFGTQTEIPRSELYT